MPPRLEYAIYIPPENSQPGSYFIADSHAAANQEIRRELGLRSSFGLVKAGYGIALAIFTAILLHIESQSEQSDEKFLLESCSLFMGLVALYLLMKTYQSRNHIFNAPSTLFGCPPQPDYESTAYNPLEGVPDSVEEIGLRVAQPRLP
jgi:hypothetical protein